MKEIRIKKLGWNTTEMLVEFYDSGVMLDWREFNDTRDIQKAMADFLFGDYKIIHN